MNVAATKQTVYHLGPLRLWLVPGIFAGLAILLLLAIFDTDAPADTRNLAIYMGMGSLVFAAIMYLVMRRARLVLSDDGVKLHQFGYKLETGWDNIASLCDADGAEGLVLRSPMDCPGARTLSAFRDTKLKDLHLYSDEQMRLIAEHRFIPIAAFAPRLDKGGLRDDLTRRAPALRDGRRQA